jgi:hypothetical protein
MRRNQGISAVEIVIAMSVLAIPVLASYRVLSLVRASANKVSQKATVEKELDFLLGRITKTVQARAAQDPITMPKPLKGTGTYGSNDSIFPQDGATCPRPAISGTTEPAPCQDLRVFQPNPAGGYKEIRFRTSCVSDYNGTGTDPLPLLIRPFTTTQSPTLASNPQVCGQGHTGPSGRLPRFMIQTFPDMNSSSQFTVEKFPQINVSESDGGQIRGMAVCFRVCSPLTLDPFPYRSPETVMIQIAAVYSTGEKEAGKPKYGVVTRQKTLSFLGQSSSVEVLPP